MLRLSADVVGDVDEGYPTGERVRPLNPREHGAYVQALVPLVVALAMGRPTVAAAALALLAVVLFWSHEPLAVLLGHRGRRTLRRDGRRAVRCLWFLELTAATALALGLLVGPPVVWALVALPLAASGLAVVLVLTGRERTLAGEMAAMAALTAWSVPVAAAAGATSGQALHAWWVWLLVFGMATVAVRLVGRRKEGASGWPGVVAAVIAVAATTVGATLSWWPATTVAAVLPAAVVTVAVSVLRPHPRHMRLLGWTFAVTAAATGLVLVLG